MVELPIEFLKKIKERLTAEEKHLAKEEKKISERDPFLVPERDVGNPEFVEEAGEEIGHTEVVAERGLIQRLQIETRLALSKFKIGKYGICEKCGNRIDRARLEVFPQARYCVTCERKIKGKRG